MLTDENYGVDSVTAAVEQIGVADERAVYQPTTGLVRNLHWRVLREAKAPIPPFPGARKGHLHRNDRGVIVQDEVGYFGYFAGPGTYVVDAWALTDPLLARLPYRPGKRWRVGHYPRPIPPGYLKSLKAGGNRFADPAMRAAYDDLLLVTRGPLFTWERFAAMWRLWTGVHADAFDRASRRAPQVIGDRLPRDARGEII